MSYCRFQNTASDLKDCDNALEELFSGYPDSELSADELRAATSLIATCQSILEKVQHELETRWDSRTEIDVMSVEPKVIKELLRMVNNDLGKEADTTDEDEDCPVER